MSILDDDYVEKIGRNLWMEEFIKQYVANPVWSFDGKTFRLINTPFMSTEEVRSEYALNDFEEFRCKSLYAVCSYAEKNWCGSVLHRRSLHTLIINENAQHDNLYAYDYRFNSSEFLGELRYQDCTQYYGPGEIDILISNDSSSDPSYRRFMNILRKDASFCVTMANIVNVKNCKSVKEYELVR